MGGLPKGIAYFYTLGGNEDDTKDSNSKSPSKTKKAYT